MLNRNKAIETAARLLKITQEEASEFCHDIDGIDALYFSVPEKGGGSLIVDDKDEVLYAVSAVGFYEHIDAYKNGIRTPLDAFDY